MNYWAASRKLRAASLISQKEMNSLFKGDLRNSTKLNILFLSKKAYLPVVRLKANGQQPAAAMNSVKQLFVLKSSDNELIF